MYIHDPKYKEPKYLPHLKPLFDALIAGRTIRKVVCMNGTDAKARPNQDLVFENFTATCYTNMVSSFDNTNLDEVIVNKNAIRIIDDTQTTLNRFYMLWVRSFNIEDCLELPDGTKTEMKDPFLFETKQ